MTGRHSTYNYWEATGGLATLQLDKLNTSLKTGTEHLQLGGSSDFESTGFGGGPFSPNCQIYTLTNPSPTAIAWETISTQPWVHVEPSNSTLAAHSATTVTVCVEASADFLPPGSYPDMLLFRNMTNGVATGIPVTLTVREIATMPFFDDFESGNFQPYWQISGTGEARTSVTAEQTPIDSFHALLDDSVNSSLFSRNELTLTIDLAGWSNVVLRCQAKEIQDEPHGPPPSPFLNGADFDGIAVSEDGTTWFEILGLRTLSSSYVEQIIDLDTAVSSVGLNYNSQFLIRFNQYDNFAVPNDGIAIDNVELTGNGPSTVAAGTGTYVDSNGLPHTVWMTTSGLLYQFQFKTNLTDGLPLAGQRRRDHFFHRRD